LNLRLRWSSKVRPDGAVPAPSPRRLYITPGLSEVGNRIGPRA
jgi:hypothetical protein